MIISGHRFGPLPSDYCFKYRLTGILLNLKILLLRFLYPLKLEYTSCGLKNRKFYFYIDLKTRVGSTLRAHL